MSMKTSFFVKICKLCIFLLIVILLLFNIKILSSYRFGLKLNIWKYYSYTASKPTQIHLPIKDYNYNHITDTYGALRPNGRKHDGQDLFCDIGTPIQAVVSGNIVYKGDDKLGGKVIYLLGIDNRLYYYAHLSAFSKIETGQFVRQCDIIGYSGNSGNAITTPPHLHFEIIEIKWLFPLIYKSINPLNEFEKERS